MADKVSTIRIKAVGMGEAANEVDDFSRRYSAAMVRVDQANNLAAQKKSGMAAGLLGIEEVEAATQKLTAAREKASRIAERAGVVDPMAGFANRESDLLTAGVKALEKFQGNAQAEEAIERAFAAEEANIEAQRTAHLAKEATAREGIRQKESEAIEKGIKQREEDRAPLYAQASDTNRSFTRAVDVERKETIAALRAGIIDRAKAAEEQVEIEARADAQRIRLQTQTMEEIVKIEAKADAQREQLNARMYAATHTRQENELRNLSEFYAEKRRLYAEDMTMLTRLGEAEAAEQQAIMNQPGGKMGLHGFGGRMILGMAAGRAAGDIIGDKEGGQEIGSLIAAFAFLPAPIAAAVGALDLVGQAFKSQREAAQAAAAAVVDWSDRLAEGAARASDLATSLVHRDTFGGAMEKDQSRAYTDKFKASEEMAKMLTAGRPAWETGAWDTKFGELQRVAADEARTGQEEGRAKSEEDKAHLQGIQKITDAEMKLNEVGKTVFGPLRERAEIAAKIELADAKRLDHIRVENALLEVGVKISREKADAAAGALYAEAYRRIDPSTDHPVITAFFGDEILRANQEAQRTANLVVLKAGVSEANRMADAARHALDQVRQQQQKDDQKAERENAADRAAPAIRGHQQAIQQVERDASEAQYLMEERHAKTLEQFRAAKHDYEVREAERQNPLKDKADIEAEVKAKDALDQLKQQLKPERAGMATDRYTQGFVNLRTLDMHDPAMAIQQKQADLLAHIEFNTRAGGAPPRHFSAGGEVGGSGSGDTVPAMLTPGERVLTVDENKAFKKYGQQAREGFIDSEYSGSIAQGGTKTIGGITLGKGGDFDVQANLRAASKRERRIPADRPKDFVQKPQNLNTRTLIENQDTGEDGSKTIGGDTRGLEGTVLDLWEQKNYRRAYESRYGNAYGQYDGNAGDSQALEKTATGGVRAREKTGAEQMADWEAHDKVLLAQKRYEAEHGPQQSDSSITQGMSDRYHAQRGDPHTTPAIAPSMSPTAPAWASESADMPHSRLNKGEAAALQRQHDILEHKVAEETAKGHGAAAARYKARADKLPHESAWAETAPGKAVAPKGPTPYPSQPGTGAASSNQKSDALLQSIDNTLKEILIKGHGPS